MKPQRSRRNNGRQSNNTKKPNSNSKEEKIEGRVKSKYNDASWYVGQGQLAKDVASFSFNTPLGPVVRLSCSDNLSGTYVEDSIQNVPGIMSIFTGPAVTPGSDESTAINIAARNIYSFVRHANSGHTNYESADLMMYLLAMDSLYSMVAFMQRIYGLCRIFSQRNRYIGDALISAMGVDPALVRANLSQFRSQLNMFITKLSAFATPSIMSLYARHMWMYSGVYQDEDVAKSQFYMYVPAYLWKYDETSLPGKLVPQPIVAKVNNNAMVREQNLNFMQLFAKANIMLNAIVGSEDIGIMSGDILKAFGDTGLWKLQLIGEDYSVVPVYSEEVLDQIHNTGFTGNLPMYKAEDESYVHCSVNMEAFYLTQDTSINGGTLIFNPYFEGKPSLSYDSILDMGENDPTPERVIVATRNMISGTRIANGNNLVYKLSTCGSDLCFFAYVYYYSSNGSLSTTSFAETDLPAAGWNNVDLLTKFHKYPFLFRSDDGATVRYVLGEVGNYTILDYHDKIKLHESAFLSLLSVPV